jgi:hypothetical protein
MNQITMQRITLGQIGMVAIALGVIAGQTLPSGAAPAKPTASPAATSTPKPTAKPTPKPTAKPTPKPGKPPIPAKPLPLSDYDKKELQDLLSIGKWEEANALTSRLMLKLGGQLRRGYLIAQDVRKLPCKDLAAIDSTWVAASQEQYGFSIQAKLWQQMKAKDGNDAIKFEQRVGWDEDRVIFEPILSPVGHLPLRPFEKTGVPNAWGAAWLPSITQQLVTCKIIEAPPAPVVKPSPKPTGKPTLKPTAKPIAKPTPRTTRPAR